MYKIFIRPFLFLLNPETAHSLVFSSLEFLFKIPFVQFFFQKYFFIAHLSLQKNIAGINFPNPIGLAAGFDKNARYIDILSSLGFGFVEIGTVTPLAQNGNDKPRLFRLPKDEALINRMGFNNDGVDKIVERLKKRKSNIIVGGNIGKNKNTPNENAVNDYKICFEKMFDYVHYFAVNVSSPNTPNLRELQDKAPLTKILSSLQELNSKKEKPKPIFLKIAPDLSNEQLDDIILIIQQTKISGVIATNTTIARENLRTPNSQLQTIGAGGLSGKPLANRSTEIIRYLSEKRLTPPHPNPLQMEREEEGAGKKAFAIIGVGGIHSAKDAMEKINAGADLVQVYTGFIYEGVSLIKKINREMLKAKS